MARLDELIRVSTAHNSFGGIEHLTDEELEAIREKRERRDEAKQISEKESNQCKKSQAGRRSNFRLIATSRWGYEA
jgi:low affinity Fe/Cu permease